MTTPDEPPPTSTISRRALHAARSIVLVNTGDGKGKSTAAFGVVMRAVARDWKVAVVQFLKSGEWHVGEEDIARRLGVEWWALGEGFTWDSENLTQDQAVAREAWAHAQGADPSGRVPARRARRDHLPDDVGLDRHRRRGRDDPRPPGAGQRGRDRTRRARRARSTSPTRPPRCARSSTRTTRASLAKKGIDY